MGTYLSPGLAQSVRGIFLKGMAHTYTRTPQVEAAIDGYARVLKTPGTPQSGLRCRYVARTLLHTTDTGFVLATEPPATGGSAAFVETLMVPADDPLEPNDTISNIIDQNGRLLLAGPVGVASIMQHAGWGETTCKVLVLRGDTVERAI